MEPAPHRRDSDRWVTPAVVCTALVVAGVLVLSVVAAMVYLTVRGLDPDPMLKLTAQAGGAVAAVVNLWVSLASRATVTKTERNTGRLAARVDALEAPPVDERTAPATGGELAGHDALYPPVPAGAVRSGRRYARHAAPDLHDTSPVRA